MTLTNRYFVLRHGRSVANDAHVIVSRAEHAATGYGITDTGRMAVATSAMRAQSLGWPIDRQTCIVSSPFLRTVESAQVVADFLKADISRDDRLRERDFGNLELQADRVYETVWDADKKSPDHHRWGVESLAMVASRTSEVVQDLERSTSHRTILLCTHGDVASVLICRMLDHPLHTHRQVGSLEPGELVMIDVEAGVLRRQTQNKAIQVIAAERGKT